MKQTPVDQTMVMIKQGLDPIIIRGRLGVSEKHAEQLIRLAKREIETQKTVRRDYGQRYNLPGQIEAAKAKLEALKRKARYYGMDHLI